MRAERKQAVFSLEREKAIRDTYNIFATAMVLLLIMGMTYFVSTTLAEAVQPLVDEALAPTPPLPFVPTPTNTPLPTTPTPTSAPTAAADTFSVTVETTPAVTVTVTAEAPTVTPVPAPLVQAPNCPDTRSLLLRPGNGETVSGMVNVIGSATHDGFQYYKVEYAPGAGASGGFQYLGGGNSPVVNALLASFDSSALGNGAWTIQLIVVDQTGNYPPPCQVTIHVQN